MITTQVVMVPVQRAAAYSGKRPDLGAAVPDRHADDLGLVGLAVAACLGMSPASKSISSTGRAAHSAPALTTPVSAQTRRRRRPPLHRPLALCISPRGQQLAQHAPTIQCLQQDVIRNDLGVRFARYIHALIVHAVLRSTIRVG